MAELYTLELIKGDSYDIPITVTENDIAVDITNFTFYLTVKQKTDTANNDTAAVIQKTVAPGSHTDPTNGETSIPLTKTDTNITAGIYYYDIEMVNGNSVTSITRSLLVIKQDVTRTS